jgi:hypothetical protein
MGSRPESGPTSKIPAEISSQLRALTHDLSNSIETILQASYLLGQCKLDGNAKKWADMIDKASRNCVQINRELREVLRSKG